jgi:hypothetical protein
MSGGIDDGYMDGVDIPKNNNVIEELIQKHMHICPAYVRMYCDTGMCQDCSFCNRNIALEYAKINKICPKCHGHHNVVSVYTNGYSFISKTSVCNVCGGTGKYPV